MIQLNAIRLTFEEMRHKQPASSILGLFMDRSWLNHLTVLHRAML